MYVEKIEIPAFRVLRNVTLEFGEAYSPQVFPLGSENGGGKSTILQLIFMLLHGCADPARHKYVANLLASDFYGGNEDQRVIAKLTIKVEHESHILEFYSIHKRLLDQKLEEPTQFGFDTEDILIRRREEYKTLESRLENHNRVSERYANSPERELRAQDVMELLEGEFPRYRMPPTVQGLQDYLREVLPRLMREAEENKIVIDDLSADMDRIQSLLVALNFKYITTYACPTPSARETRAFVCRVSGQSVSKTEELLRRAESNVFLLGPSNQQYLFLSKDARRALLGTTSRRRQRANSMGEMKKPRPQIEYLSDLDRAEGAMEGFYAYDWLSVEPLVRLFLSARDEDFQNVVKTGRYGERYTTLLREVNGLLLGKTVRPVVDTSGVVSGVEFIVQDSAGETPLSPEDLSQGELKRLMLYAWLRTSKVQDSLVLIDEIEASFHPDWQTGIVRDLLDWGPKNQYILATHSYELCQALTPRHVRELEPHLRPGNATSE